MSPFSAWTPGPGPVYTILSQLQKTFNIPLPPHRISNMGQWTVTPEYAKGCSRGHWNLPLGHFRRTGNYAIQASLQTHGLVPSAQPGSHSHVWCSTRFDVGGGVSGLPEAIRSFG